MKLIDSDLLDKVSKQAEEHPRLRMNHNFHASLDAKAQKLLNALEPGTDLPIHRHTHTAETYLLLRGKLKVIFFDEDGEPVKSAILDPVNGKFGIDIPAGQWHTIEVLESGTVIFEVKDEPYQPLEKENIMTVQAVI